MFMYEPLNLSNIYIVVEVKIEDDKPEIMLNISC